MDERLPMWTYRTVELRVASGTGLVGADDRLASAIFDPDQCDAISGQSELTVDRLAA